MSPFFFKCLIQLHFNVFQFKRAGRRSQKSLTCRRHFSCCIFLAADPFPITKLAYPKLAVSKINSSLPIFCTVSKFSDIFFSVGPCVSAPTSPLAIFPFTNVVVSVAECISAFAVMPFDQRAAQTFRQRGYISFLLACLPQIQFDIIVIILSHKPVIAGIDPFDWVQPVWHIGAASE